MADDLLERTLLDDAFAQQSLEYCIGLAATQNIDDRAGIKNERPGRKIVTKQSQMFSLMESVYLESASRTVTKSSSSIEAICCSVTSSLS